MKITALRKLPGHGDATGGMRGTDAQDVPKAAPDSRRRRWMLIGGAAGGAVLLMFVFVWLLGAWSASANTIPRERLRTAVVESGRFVRDVAAQGTVVAAVSPTVFAVAPGVVDYQARAGDEVKKDQPLAVLESPELRNEYEREQATLDSLDAALARQSIEIRRQILRSQQQADLAKVQIQAAERELKRAESAWAERVISERDFRRAQDDLDTAKLNYEHARDTAGLERDSLNLELRTKRLERDRQALAVADLERRVAALTVRAPVDGIVANLAQPQRASVSASAPLLTVVDLSAFEVEFQVADTYARDIRAGMSAEITIDGRTHAGTVAAISPEVRQSQVTGRLKFAGVQPPGLRQNQRATVRIVLDEREGVMRFARGAQLDEGTRFVYVVRGDLAVRTPVELGAASVSQIEVIRGLSPGDRVVVSDMRDFGEATEVLITD